jgi:hypothetical protein
MDGMTAPSWQRQRQQLAQRVAGRTHRLIQTGALPEMVDPALGLPVWMDPIEFSQIVAVLEVLQPKVVVEWGAGGSTRGFLARSPFVQRWVSIEHDGAWAKNVQSTLRDPRLEVHHVGPAEAEPPPADGDADRHKRLVAWRNRAETDRALFADYIDKPAQLGLQPDLALVDGRARSLCIAEAMRILRPGGVVILHDAQRGEYHEAMHAAGRAVFLQPWNQGQVALVTKPLAMPAQQP